MNRAQVRVVARGRGGVQGRRYDRERRDGEESGRVGAWARGACGVCEEGVVLAYKASRRPSKLFPVRDPQP